MNKKLSFFYFKHTRILLVLVEYYPIKRNIISYYWLLISTSLNQTSLSSSKHAHSSTSLDSLWPVGWGCRIYQLHLCRGVRPPPNECPRYDTEQSDGEVPEMLELCGVLSTPSFPSLPGPLWPRMVTLDWVLFMGQIELNCVLMLNWIAWNRTVFDIETVYLF